MKGMIQNGFQQAACLALISTVLLVFAITGTWEMLLSTVILAAVAPFLARIFYLQLKRWWSLPLFLAISSAVAISIAYFIHPFPWWLGSTPALAFVTSTGAGALARMTQNRCGLCHKRLGPHEVTFTCPRCELVVCDENCWSFEHRRCRLCEENGVPILPSMSQWWDRQLGPRATQGRCQVCMASPEKADLRICSHCRRPQCRECWDQTNGECGRCGWTLPELPESLKEIAVHLPMQGKR